MCRYELRDIATVAGVFQPGIPSGLPIVEETGDFTDALGASIPPQPVGVVLKAAGAVTRQAATEAAKAARNVLRWLDTR